MKAYKPRPWQPPSESNGWEDHAYAESMRRQDWLEEQVSALWADADALRDALAHQLECPPDIEVCDALVRGGDDLAQKLRWWLDPILATAVEALEARRAEP